MFQPFLFWGTLGNLFTNKSLSIDTILSKSDFTIEDLLENEEVFQDVQNDNQSLIKVLVKLENLRALVYYVVKDCAEEEDSDREKQLRLKKMAADLLSAGNANITTSLFEQPELLNELLNKFCSYNEPSSESGTMDVVSKVLASLLDDLGLKMVRLIMKMPDFFNVILLHLEDEGIIDLFLKVVSNIDSDQEVIEWVKNSGILSKLSDLVGSDSDCSVSANASRVLLELTGLPELNSLLNLETVSAFFSSIFTSLKCSASERKRSHEIAFVILNSMLKREAAERFTSADDVSIDDLPPISRYFLQHLGLLEDFLKTRTPDEVINTTVGKIETFGITRLKVMEMIHTLVSLNYESILLAFMNAGIFNLCMDLFLYYKFNNFLHSIVVLIFHDALAIVSCKDLHFHILKSVCIPQQILQIINDNEAWQENTKIIRPGYLGHLLQIAEDVHDRLTQMSDSTVESHLPDQMQYIQSMKERINDYRSKKNVLLKTQQQLKRNFELPLNEHENYIFTSDEDLVSLNESQDQEIADYGTSEHSPPTASSSGIEREGKEAAHSREMSEEREPPHSLSEEQAQGMTDSPSKATKLEKELSEVQISCEQEEHTLTQ